jgi:prophage regulatory protein
VVRNTGTVTNFSSNIAHLQSGCDAQLKIIRLDTVEELTGLKKSSLYKGIQDHTFPAPIKLGPRAVGWIYSEVIEWIEDRVNMTRRQAA